MMGCQNKGVGDWETDDRNSSDAAFLEAQRIASAITVPGGLGPMTTACLLRNTLIAAHAVEASLMGVG